ncbi:MAG: WD40/YVTN/BNR-like repeat-containing protein [Sphingomonas sp.]
MSVRHIALGLTLAITPALAVAAPRASADYHWRSVTVGGGGFAPGVVFSPAVSGLAYLRTDMGGAYRWEDAAGRWTPLEDSIATGSYMGVESVAADPVDPDTVYLAVGMSSRSAAAILRSTDRGAHWQIVPVPFRMGGNENGRGLGERLAIDPRHTATLLFGSRHQGLWRSDDSAHHWHKVAGFPLPGLGLPSGRSTHGGLSFVLFAPRSPGRIFVASADPGQHHLFVSDDDGKSWSAVAGGPETALLPAKGVIGSDGVLTITYCDGIGPTGITRGAVWRYDPASGQWTDVTPDKRPEAPPGGYMGVAVSARDPQLIAVSTIDRSNPVDTVWRSEDAGRHWQALWTRSTRDVSATPFLNLDGPASNFGHWIAGLAIDPFDDSHAAYVTGATVYATRHFDTAGTMPWTPWTAGIEQTAIITMVSPTGGAPLVSGFGDIAGFRHTDLTTSPAHLHLNPFLTNTNTLDYAGLAPDVMVRSGSTHSHIAPGPTLAWSGDNGESWRPLDPPHATSADGAPDPLDTGDAPIVVSADGETFVVGGASPMLTRDRGKIWQPVRGLPPRVRITADKADARRFYAIDFTANRILRSDDGGTRFHPVVRRGLPADLSAARVTWREAQDPMRATPGAAGALWLRIGGALYRSLDAGETWRRTAQGLSIAYYGLGKAAPGTRWPALYAIGTRDGREAVWRSIDGGDHWRRINDDAHQWGLRFRCIIGDPKQFGRVYIGTDGRGILYGDPTGGAQRSAAGEE